MTPEPVIPISAIEHFVYCPRQCALIHCDGVWSDNAHTVKGTRAHRRVDSGRHRAERGRRVLRGIPLWSESLGLSGRSDVVEIDGDTVRPVEYKSGVPHGMAADFQLCAQAMCLEEMLDVAVASGSIWYGGPRRRIEIEFNSALRDRVRAAIDAIREQLLAGALPDAVDDERCTECQLVHHCLPGVTRRPRQDPTVHVPRRVRMRYLSTLYVRDHRARIQHRRGSLTVSSPKGSQRVPLEAIDSVVLLGAAQVTSQALDACVSRGIRVAALRRNGSVRFVVNGATNGNVHLRTALFEAVHDGSRSLELARSTVAAKLQNSRKVVSRWSRDEKDAAISERLAERSEQIRQRIGRLVDAVTGDGLRGIEGDAARIHFRALEQVVAKTELRFSSRTRRPPRDPVNAMLSFCYGLVVTECTGALEGVGLDHQMGFFHRPRAGRPSLALDLAEELRALTDRFIVSLIRRRQIGPTGFEFTPGGGVYLTDDARTALIKAWEDHKETEISHAILGRPVGRWAIPSIQATLLARHLRGDLSAYPPFVLP